MPLVMAAMACSRMPKCMFEPLLSSAEKSPRFFMFDLLEGARSAEPPMRLGMRSASLFSTPKLVLRVASGLANSNSEALFLRSGSSPLMNSLYCAASSGYACSYSLNSFFHLPWREAPRRAMAAQCSATSAGISKGSHVQPRFSFSFCKFSLPRGEPWHSCEPARGEP